MNKIFLILCLMSVFVGKEYYAQHRRGDPDNDGPRKRIEELEKIKLLETLNLDEKTMLQFFSRRKEYNDQIKNLEDERSDILNAMQKLVEENAGEQDFKKAITDVLNIDNRINKAKEEYITSLDDILTNEQIAKLYLFERNFRKEIKQIILKHRRGD